MISAIRQSIGPIAAVFGVGYIGYMLMPVQLSGLIERFDFNERDAGMAASLQLGALAVALFITAPFLARFGGKKIVLLGCLLAIAGHWLISAADQRLVLQIALVLSGVGMGAALAGGDALISASRSPDRLFAAGLAVGQFAAALLLIIGAPQFIGMYGPKGAHLLISGWLLLMFLLIVTTSSESAANDHSHSDFSSLAYFSPPIIALLLIGLGDASVWPFTGEIGASLGLTGGSAETVQGFALLAGIAGATIASLIGTKWGRIFPLIFGVGAASILYFLILNAPNAALYAAAQISALFFYGFCVPYFFGICASLDSTGRLMAAAAGMQMVGLAAGPWLAGEVISRTGYFQLGLTVSGLFLFALLLGLPGAMKEREN